MTKRKADGVERVYEHVKRRAVDFGFDPGQKVKEGELAAEFGVSRIPVREALNRLVTEGFMSFIPNRGFFCRDIDSDEILALYQVRAALEMWSFKTACGTATDDALKKFCRFWSSKGATARFKSLDAYDAEFHFALAELSGNPILLKQLRQIEDKILVFRNLELKDDDRREKTLGEHRQIVTHLSDRQAEAGSLLVEKHILSSAENAIAAARSRFADLR